MVEETNRLASIQTITEEDSKRVLELLEQTEKDKRRLQVKNAKATVTGKYRLVDMRSCAFDLLLLMQFVKLDCLVL